MTLTGENAPSRARSSWCSCCCYAPASSCCSCLGRCCPRLLLASRRDPWSPCLARPPRALGGLLPGAARRACQPCVWLSWGRTQDGVPRPLPPLWASPSACGPPASRPKAAPFNAGTAGTFVVDLDTTNDNNNNNNNNNNSNNNKEAVRQGATRYSVSAPCPRRPVARPRVPIAFAFVCYHSVVVVLRECGGLASSPMFKRGPGRSVAHACGLRAAGGCWG